MAQLPKAPLEPARRGRAALLNADAHQAARTAFTRAGFADPTLVLHWDAIVGPDVARLARPIRLTEGPEGGTLSIKVQPGAALFLQHETRSLMARINAFLGRPAVARLRISQGALVPRKLTTAQKRVPGLVEASDPANSFKGPESVRAALLDLARWRTRQA